MIRPSRNTRDRCTHAESTTVDVLELSTDDRKAADELWRAMRPVLAGAASPDEWDVACIAWRNYRPSSWRGWKRRPWIKLLSGLTSSPSTVEAGIRAWISSPLVSPANRSAPPVNSWALTMTVGSGRTSPVSSVTWDPDSCSWKTSQELFRRAFPKFCLRLPSSGLMRNGVVSPLPPLVPLTNGTVGGAWPTARASDGSTGSTAHSRSDFRPTLKQKASALPTPTSTDALRNSQNSHASGTYGEPLSGMVRQWETPKTSDLKSVTPGMPSDQSRRSPGLRIQAQKPWPTPTTHDSKAPRGDAPRDSPDLADVVHGHRYLTMQTDGNDGLPQVDLNPSFVEALMGVPPSWSSVSTSSATDLSHWLEHMRSALFSAGAE